MGVSRWESIAPALGFWLLSAHGAHADVPTGVMPSAAAEQPTDGAASTAPSPAPAEATGAAPASDQPPVPMQTQAPLQTPPDWSARYAEARALLIDGKFDDAAQRFASLANSATNPTDRAVAIELGSVAAGWSARRLAQGHEADVSDVHHDRRSTDEIASLYLNSVVYGLGTGAFIAVQVRPTSPGGIILPALLLGGGAAGVVAAIDSGAGLGYGVPQSIISGMYIGLGEGIVWTLWNQARVSYYDEWSDKTIASVIWSSATLGAVAGGALGNAYGATPGRASYVGSLALWSGLATGLVTGALVKDDEHADDNALLAGAIAMNAGAVAGILTAHSVSPSIARVRFLDLGAISGGLVFGGLYLSAAGQDPNPQTALGFTALGIGAGFATAWYLTSGMKKDTNGGDAPNRSVSMTVMPLKGGLGLSAYGSL